jgi:hypothetical protein
VVAFYDERDRAAGGITSLDRLGHERRFRFLSVSIGLVNWCGEEGVGLRRLVEIAAEVKGAAKRRRGPAVVKNARAL